MNIPPNSRCPRCGTPLPGGVLSGLCPECLVRVSLHARFDRSAPGGGVGTSDSIIPLRLGDFEILDELGRGGMGVVWRARQVSLNRIVALKTSRDSASGEAARDARFLAEAESAARLNHPNIVPVFEVGEAEGRSYLAMQLIEGGTLADELAAGSWAVRNGPRGAVLVAKLARAVHYAHQHGVIHRDLKPGNVLVDEEGEPHVTDFGLAHWLDNSFERSGGKRPEVVGTPAYMAPEQAAGCTPITTAADIYSLGAILYHLLTGQPPFDAESRDELLRRVIENPPAPPRSCRVEVDRDLEAICLKCLAKDPLERYSSAASLADDLERWNRGEDVRARRASRLEQLGRWTRRRPAVAALTVTIVLALASGLAGISWQWRRAERETRRVRETARREADALRRSEEARATLLDQARDLRASRRPGHRFKALEAVAAAARLRPGLELRNEALAALVMTDLQEAGSLGSFPESIAALAVSPDLAWGVGMDRNGVAHSIEFAANRPPETSGLPSLPTAALGFSPDGKWLAASGPTGGLCWRSGTSQVSHRWPHPLGERNQATWAFAPDSSLLAVHDGNEAVRIIDLRSNRIELEIHAGAMVDAVAFSPQGTHLAVLGGRTLQIRRAGDGRLESRLLVPPSNCVEWPGDGARLFVASKDSRVWVLDPLAGTVRPLADIDPTAVPRMVPHPRGKLLLLPGPGRAGSQLWELPTARPLLAVSEKALRFDREGRHLCGLRDGTEIVIWTVLEPEGFTVVPLGDPQAWPVDRMTELEPPARVAPGSDGSRPVLPDRTDGSPGRRVRLVSQSTGETLAELTPPLDTVLDRAAVTPDGGRVVAHSVDGDCLIWDLTRLRATLAAVGLDWAEPPTMTPMAKLSGMVTTAELILPSASARPLSQRAPDEIAGVMERSAEATRDQIDLTPHFNALLHENWMGGRPEIDDSFVSLPRGLHRLGEVLFDIRGVVQLAGTADQVARDSFPRAVRDVRVGVGCDRLHFLAAGRWALAGFAGLAAAHVVLHYADGSATTNVLTTGVDLGDAWDWPGRTADASRAEVVWRGTNATSASFGASLRLFRRTLDNPRPAERVVTLDIVSTLSPVAPFIVAITAESDPGRQGR